MASPRKLASKLCNLSPRLLSNVNQRGHLSPRTPTRDAYKQKIDARNQFSPFNIDTPNRRKILENGLPTGQGSFLGSGGFGIVYKASYKGHEVAAKVMQREKCSNVLNSEKHASLLRHSNIVKILMIEEGPSLSLITMELCGSTLQDRLDEAQITKNDRVSILKGVTCALQFCHNAGIVHADVKPKNILMSENGQPKLTDFGSSVLIAEPNKDDEFHGTPGYTAPEVIRGNKPTPAADIYSLGIVAWQMLSRQLPFNGLHCHAALYLSAKGHRPEDNDLDDEFGGAYKSLYGHMWSQSTTDRPTSSEVISKVDTLITC